jgi:glycosyltransferase involved in cell wall biosynthesis
MDHPKVSVIMSVYNDEKHIRPALESILNQTFADFEFIIVNDGSTDGTEEIIRSCRDPRIRLVNQENRGLTRSLNRALSLARADYFARMDGDDISERQRFARQVAFLDDNGHVGIVGSFAYRLDEKGRRCSLFSYPVENDDIKEALRSTCPMCHSSVMYRRACIERVGPYREKVGPTEDLDLYFRVSEHFDMANIPEPLHAYRVDPEGITIRRRFDQMRYDKLVRKMAEQRMQTGRDRLDEMSEEEIARLLEQFLPRTLENEKKVISASCIHLAEVSYVSGDYGSAARWLTKFLTTNPLSRRGWVLAAKLAACSLVPKDRLRRIGRVGRLRASVGNGPECDAKTASWREKTG